MENEEEDNDAFVMDPEADEAEPLGGVGAAGGLSALDVPGAAEALSLMAKSSADARAALVRARESISARKYSRAHGLLAASAALGAPTRAGSTAESFGALSGALKQSLGEREAFEQAQARDLLGVDTSLASLDEKRAQAMMQLATLRANLASKQQQLPNERVVINGETYWVPRPLARYMKAWTPEGTKISVGGEEGAEEKGVGTYHSKVYENLQEAGLAAPVRLGKLDRMEALMEGIQTSKLTPLIADVQSIAEGFGIKINNKLGPMQAADALFKEVALTLRNPSGGAGMPGALSNQDRKFLEQMSPSLAQSPEGRRLIIETARKLAERDRQVAKLARDYRKRNKLETKKGIDEGFFDELEAWSEKNPLFRREEARSDSTDADTEMPPPDEEASIPPMLRRPDTPAMRAPIPSPDDAAATEPGTISFYDLKRRQ